jgi:uncharacterized protein YjbI with pentapeptide repeats
MLNSNMIGNKIAEARKKINISQAQLAQRLFISSQAVGKWERGESMPDIITLNRLSEIFGVDLNYFSGSKQTEVTETTTIRPNVKQVKKLNWDMSRGNWVDADFSGLKNLQEKFSSSNMKSCKFVSSELSGLILKSNNVDSCDFSDSDLSNSHIKNSNLSNNLLKDCSLKETEFFESYINKCDFTGADFTGVVINSGGFEKNNISSALWNSTSFIGTYLSEIVFEGTLQDCYFENFAFNKITFQNATLINTFFKNKSLKGIKFIDCYVDRMTYEFLKNGKADLTGIKLMTS